MINNVKIVYLYTAVIQWCIQKGNPTLSRELVTFNRKFSCASKQKVVKLKKKMILYILN